MTHESPYPTTDLVSLQGAAGLLLFFCDPCIGISSVVERMVANKKDKIFFLLLLLTTANALIGRGGMIW